MTSFPIGVEDLLAYCMYGMCRRLSATAESPQRIREGKTTGNEGVGLSKHGRRSGQRFVQYGRSAKRL